MEVIATTPEIFHPAVSPEEWRQIPSEISRKLQIYVETKIEELCTAHALAETARFNNEQQLGTLKNEYETVVKAKEEMEGKEAASGKTISELELQMSICTADLNKLQEHTSELEARVAEFRKQRDTEEDEKNNYMRMLERRNAELERMQSEMTLMSTQLEAAISAKCEALVNSEEVASMKLNLEFRERQLEQTNTLLNNQIQNLTEDLNKRTEDLMNFRRENTNRIIVLESKLTSKTEEIQIVNDKCRSIEKINADMIDKLQEISEELAKERDNNQKTYESYQMEVEAQTKEATIYKDLNRDNQNNVEDLEESIRQLQGLLNVMQTKYADLEAKHKTLEEEHDDIMAKKNECIAMLKKELECANDLIQNCKNSDLQRDVETLSPAAAQANRLIRPEMSLTQIYTQYMECIDKNARLEEEKRMMNNYITKVMVEIEEKAPILRKQREDYENAIETVQELTKQSDQHVSDITHWREECSEAKRVEGIARRENERLKREVADLSRQVVNLLREVEQCRSGSSNNSLGDHDLSDSTSSADIISKKLVTFNDIADLQATNQKLLALVRELSSKQEDAEGLDAASVAALKRKLEQLREEHAQLLERQEMQDKMLSSIVGQRDMYKTLYNQALKSAGTADDIPMQLERPYPHVSTRHQQRATSQSPKPSEDSMVVDDHQRLANASSSKQVDELEVKLAAAKKEIERLKEEYETYRKERNENEKIILQQSEKLSKDLREMTTTNCKLNSAISYSDERFKVMNDNVNAYKKQIQALEEKNESYNTTIIKHEQSLMHLQDEILNSQAKLSKSEVILANMRQENLLLKDTEARLVRERESQTRNSQAQSMLLNNIELIKATLERNEAESKIRVEGRLDDATRECCALRRRLQEEQDRFRELTEHLSQQTKTAQQRMEEEQAEAERLRQELVAERAELVKRSNQIEELSKKIKTSLLTPTKAGTDEERRIQDLENLLNESEAVVKSLKDQLNNAKEQIKQYCGIAEGAEKQVKDINEHHEQFKELTGAKLQENRAEIEKLRNKCNDLCAELNVHSDGQRETQHDLKTRLAHVEIELKTAHEHLEQTRAQLQTAKADVQQMADSLKVADGKYAHEMVLHSNDLQAFTALKADFAALSAQTQQVANGKRMAEDALEENKKNWQIQQTIFQNEKEEVKMRLDDLNAQNELLLDQVQAFNAQLSVIHAQATSVGDGDASTNVSLNRSYVEDEAKSGDQLLKIIKYLRKEKDVSVSKCDILDAENARLKIQHELTAKQLEEAKTALRSERQHSEVSVITAAKHSEVLRKVETLNAITDSNRILRQERDSLSAQVKEITARACDLEERLAPLQEMNRELTQKADAAQTENTSLRQEATRWRQRANSLIEKSNRTSPEDWKKLNQEKDNLAKQLATEKETHRKLNEELINAKHSKEKLSDQVTQLQERCNAQMDELRKQNEELTNLRQNVQKLQADLQETKANLQRMINQNSKITEELGTKDSAITEMKTQVASMRKIAKKFKSQYDELNKVVEEENQKKKERLESGQEEEVSAPRQEQLREEGRKEVHERVAEVERHMEERVEELHAQMTAYIEEGETLKREIGELKKTGADKDERAKLLLKSAKGRIVDLTEALKAKTAEVEELKKRAAVLEQNKDGEESASHQLEEIQRLQKEKEELLSRSQREIETLTQRVSQLQRQLGSKPSTSSSGAEKSTSEPPTANIKPMSGGTPTQQRESVTVTPWRSSSSAGGETPLASIRPMTVTQNVRTAAVLPSQQSAPQASAGSSSQASTSGVQGSSSSVASAPAGSSASAGGATAAPSTSTSSSSSCMVPPQQQVHTTGGNNSSAEIMSSSPTSSHTDYMPATSSASPALLAPRQVAVPPTQSNQDSGEEQQVVQQQQAVAMVLPRIEIPSGGSAAQEQGTSSSSSSNTVTTTQAGLKRPREADTDSQGDEPTTKAQPQVKRTRVQTGTAEPFQGVSESGLEVEYQVPTSSQRDQEDDIIVLESEDDGEPDEGEGGDDAEPDDADGEGYDMVYEREQELNYEDDNDCQAEEMDEQDAIAEDNNEVEVIEDSSEVPNQSSMQTGMMESHHHHVQEGGHLHSHHGHPEATSSGSEPGTGGNFERIPAGGITLSQAGSTFGSRTRPVAPLSRQQPPQILPHSHGLDSEGGDDGIVPSTPTLYVPRRTDGFGEAVSSPHVPTGSGTHRFTFGGPEGSGGGSAEELAGRDLDLSQLEESTGRSVPSTPQQTSPQESVGIGMGAEVEHQVAQQLQSSSGSAPDQQDNIRATREEHADAESGGEQQVDSVPVMGPPQQAQQQQSTSSSTSAGGDSQQEEMEGADDGVSSEGEKAGPPEEEGREAEASESPSSNTRSRGGTPRGSNYARRANRTGFRASSAGHRGGMSRPTPIVWGGQQGGQGGQQQQQQQAGLSPRQEGSGRGRGSPQESPNRGPYGNRMARRSRSRPHAHNRGGPFSRY